MSNTGRSETMKTRALIIGTTAATMLFFILGICQAQEIKIGFVDLMKFAQQSQRAKEQQQRFVTIVEKKRAAIEKLKKELVDAQQQYEKQGPMLNESVRSQKLKEIGIKEMEVKLAEKDAQAELQNEQRDAQEIFRRDVSKIIGQLRGQKKLTLVMNAEALLSADDALDITEDVIKQYDAEAGKAAAPKPAPKPAPAPPAAGPKPKPK
jgi:outer membrane protein